MAAFGAVEAGRKKKEQGSWGAGDGLLLDLVVLNGLPGRDPFSYSLGICALFVWMLSLSKNSF